MTKNYNEYMDKLAKNKDEISKQINAFKIILEEM